MMDTIKQFINMMPTIWNDPYYKYPFIIIFFAAVVMIGRLIYRAGSNVPVNTEHVPIVIHNAQDSTVKPIEKDVPKKLKKEKPSHNETPRQDNRKGNFSENQKSGNVTQNYYEKPPQRVVEQSDLDIIIKTLESAPKEITEKGENVSIKISSDGTKEGIYFRDDIIIALKKMGYNNIQDEVILNTSNYYPFGAGRITLHREPNENGEKYLWVVINPQ